jgi:glycosyltransferase involved in cell wall biosynthesis
VRLAFVVQRYGADVVGGAERAAREIATRLAARGHDLEVVTSCAVSYVDWADAYPPGVVDDDGVRVHRLPVRTARDPLLFGPLNARVPGGNRQTALHVQRDWLRMQGPELDGLDDWLRARAGDFDAIAFLTYLYWPTVTGLRAVAGVTPTVLHPFAHDEPPFYLSVFESPFHLADGYAFLTEEEEALVRRRFRIVGPSVVTGLGTELEGEPASGAVGALRRRLGLGDRPYLLFVGRVDASKGAVELVDFYGAYRRRHADAPPLVVVGDPVTPLPRTRDVIVAGSVDEATKNAAIAGCAAFLVPSYFESFSIVLIEAWARARPALVQARCDVLVGQARRSGGAIPYRGFAEFEAALERVLGDQGLARSLGEAGRNYVEARYRWDAILDRYEGLLTEVIGARAAVQPRG